jgi:hypothetical protein
MKQPSNAPDFSDCAKLVESLMLQADVIRGMAPAVAKARTCLNYSGDRLKRALASACADARSAGATSAADAEQRARASTAYRDTLDTLAAADHEAEAVVAEWEAAKIKWESLRTAVSLQKAITSTV